MYFAFRFDVSKIYCGVLEVELPPFLNGKPEFTINIRCPSYFYIPLLVVNSW